VRPTPDDLAGERARRSLRVFCEWAWPLLEPATPFVPGIHIDLVCHYLERVARGEVRRLLINVPPRHGKSLLSTVMFPAWLWATAPHTRVLAASYGIDLAVRDNRRMRQLVEASAYQRRWGGHVRLVDDQNTKHRYENARGGSRVAVSVGGAATGEGGDVILIDDPQKIEHADSAPARQGAIDWFDHTLATRLNDPKTAAIVIVGQRLHQSDLFGHLLEHGDWTHLCLPTRYEPTHPYLCADDPRTHPGQLLWPNQWPEPEVARLEAGLGSYRTASMLQQLPAPSGGGIFQRGWWRYYDPTAALPRFNRVFQSWDLAFTDTPTADYVVGQVWATHGADCYLLRQTRAQLDFTRTLQAIRDQTRWVKTRYPRFAHHAILIEQAANAHAVIATLKREIRGVIPIKPEGDKINRAHAVTPQIEAGNIHLPGVANADHTNYDHARTPAWVQGLIEETAAFPNGKNDDQVDALTQALRRASTKRGRIRICLPPSDLSIDAPSQLYDSTTYPSFGLTHLRR
jgi:predicted phage terminase large subunit-like protein